MNQKDLADLIMKALIALVGSTWAIWHFVHTNRVSRVKATTDLYNQYHNESMIQARFKAWIILDRKNREPAPFRFSELWRELDEAGEFKQKDAFLYIYRIASFWFQFLSLDRRGLLDRDLAKRLFGYQYLYWKAHFSKLVADTEKDDEDSPDAIEPFKGLELAWLLEGRAGMVPYTIRKRRAGAESGPA